MGMIAAVAIYGVALGFLTGPGVRPVVIAAVSIVAAEIGAAWFCHAFERQPGVESIAWVVQACLEPYPDDLAPRMLTAASAAAVTTIFSGIVRSREQRRRVSRVSLTRD